MSDPTWNDLENNHVTYGDRQRIAARGRQLEAELAQARADVATMRDALKAECNCHVPESLRYGLPCEPCKALDPPAQS